MQGTGAAGQASASILVVEDEWLVRDMLARELLDAGYVVFESETADDAVVLFGREKIDVLLTDIRLPGRLDGWDLAEELRKHQPGLHVIYATGFSSERPRPVERSVIFQKPYRLPEIVAAVHRLVSG